MIKAGELRIGNWVQYQRNPITVELKQVIGVSEDSITILEGNQDGSCYPKSCNLFSPIPLTEEWLVKFGFRQVMKKDNYITFNNGVIKISLFSKYCVVRGHGITIQYVHQLQNLYFALTGEELELKK